MLSHLVSAAGEAVPITPVTAEALAAAAARLDEAGRRWIGAIQFTAEPGKWALLPDAGGGLARVLVGFTRGEELWALAGLPDALPEGRYRLDPAPAAPAATRLALGWALGCYAFTRYKERKRGFADLLWPDAADRPLVERLARAIGRTRDLINTPTEDMGPTELAGAVEELAGRVGARCHIIAGEALLRENYPTIHAVGRASAKPPALADLTWGDAAAPKLTLVGKGVCFDSGGLDLKTASGMRLMKKDMGGAATLIGLAEAVIDAGLELRLRLLVPAVENAVSANAFHPLDVIRTRKGITVEIGNTDAEGRLILCDALAEADAEKPALLIDMATLTGAARTALGPELPALFSNDEALAAELLRVAEAEQDPLWRMPLWRPYRKMLKSTVADITNASDSAFAGAITAAIYLAEFVSAGTPWAHIDTYAWNATARPGRPEGGEALALRALYRLIEQRFGPATP
ncbi:MAG TPA: leucyl aminopeptidase family protein [Stellaceae bacterium]|nr:leucyl aminopeptidase family protein [Stellaceae bacterium]